jgi:hypothetical protein
MDRSPNLDMPFILPSQAQKHVTHNEALWSLDALIQLAVLDHDLTAPPACQSALNRDPRSASKRDPFEGHGGERPTGWSWSGLRSPVGRA